MIRHLLVLVLGLLLWPFLCVAFVFGAVVYTLPMAMRHAARWLSDDTIETASSILVYGQMRCPSRRVMRFE